jgi:hypothetical protein
LRKQLACTSVIDLANKDFRLRLPSKLGSEAKCVLDSRPFAPEGALFPNFQPGS